MTKLEYNEILIIYLLIVDASVFSFCIVLELPRKGKSMQIQSLLSERAQRKKYHWSEHSKSPLTSNCTPNLAPSQEDGPSSSLESSSQSSAYPIVDASHSEVSSSRLSSCSEIEEAVVAALLLDSIDKDEHETADGVHAGSNGSDRSGSCHVRTRSGATIEQRPGAQMASRVEDCAVTDKEGVHFGISAHTASTKSSPLGTSTLLALSNFLSLGFRALLLVSAVFGWLISTGAILNFPQLWFICNVPVIGLSCDVVRRRQLGPSGIWIDYPKLAQIQSRTIAQLHEDAMGVQTMYRHLGKFEIAVDEPAFAIQWLVKSREWKDRRALLGTLRDYIHAVDRASESIRLVSSKLYVTTARFKNSISMGLKVIEGFKLDSPGFLAQLFGETVRVEPRLIEKFVVDWEVTYTSLNDMANAFRTAQVLFDKQKAILRKLAELVGQEYETPVEDIGVQVVAFLWTRIGKEGVKRYSMAPDYDSTLQALQTGGILQDHVTSRFPIMLRTVQSAIYELRSLKTHAAGLLPVRGDVSLEDQIAILKQSKERLRWVLEQSEALENASWTALSS